MPPRWAGWSGFGLMFAVVVAGVVTGGARPSALTHALLLVAFVGYELVCYQVRLDRRLVLEVAARAAIRRTGPRRYRYRVPTPPVGRVWPPRRDDHGKGR